VVSGGEASNLLGKDAQRSHIPHSLWLNSFGEEKLTMKSIEIRPFIAVENRSIAPSRSRPKMLLAAILLKAARHKMASPGGRRIFLSSRA
jgi:hypothetical protein